MLKERINLHIHTLALNGYEIFVLSSSLPGNEYTFVSLLVLLSTFLLFQYQLIVFYKIKKKIIAIQKENIIV